MSMYPLVNGIGNVREFSPVGKCQGIDRSQGCVKKVLYWKTLLPA